MSRPPLFDENDLLSIIPQSLHAALLKEADQEGVSLNQLCVAKLSLQLRELASGAREGAEVVASS